MPRQHPADFRQYPLYRMLAGENILSLATEYGVPEQTRLPPISWKPRGWFNQKQASRRARTLHVRLFNTAGDERGRGCPLNRH